MQYLSVTFPMTMIDPNPYAIDDGWVGWDTTLVATPMACSNSTGCSILFVKLSKIDYDLYSTVMIYEFISTKIQTTLGKNYSIMTIKHDCYFFKIYNILTLLYVRCLFFCFAIYQPLNF